MKVKNEHTSLQVDTNTELKVEVVKWILSFIGSVLIMGIVIKIANGFYNPSIEASKQLALDILVSPETAFPEPKERMLFILAVLSGSLSLFGLYRYFNFYFSKKDSKSVANSYLPLLSVAILAIVFILYKGLVAKNPFMDTPQNSHDVVAKTNMDFYFIKTFLHKNLFLYAVFLYPIIALFLLNVFKIKDELYAKINKGLRFFSLAFSLGLMALACAISTIDFPHTFENKYDFNAIYYSVVQVYNGLPMLVDNFTNTYGLYPHFIVPILKIMGLSIYNFSLIMGILLSLCFLMMYYFLAKQISNKLLVLFAFTSIFYNSYLYFRVVTNFDTAFATSPIRWLFPCFMLVFSTFYLSQNVKQNKNLLFKNNIPLIKNFNITLVKLISFCFFSLGILWSPDTGTFSFLALILFYAYQEFNTSAIKKSFLSIAIHLIIAIVLAVLMLNVFTFIVKINYGSAPELGLMFSTIKAFASLGLGMLPLPTTWHIWMLVAITYLLGILYAVRAIIKQEVTSKSTTVFLLSVFGVLFFSYYQGRSHNWNLLIINFPAFMLLAIFCDDLLKIIKARNLLIAPFALGLFLISFSVFQIIGDKEKMFELVDEQKNKTANANEQQLIIANTSIIDSLSQEKEKVVVLSAVQYQSIYHSLSKTASAINPGFVELFTIESFNAMLQKLQTEGNLKVFFEPTMYRFNNLKIQAVLASLYDVKQEFNRGNLLWYLTKKENKKSEPLILQKDNSILLYEPLRQDLNKAINYSLGKQGALKLDSVFSIEVIFKPQTLSKTPYNDAATLLSNANNEKGFVLQQSRENASQFIFATNNQGIVCPINTNSYNYIAIQVTPKTILAYSNGIKIGEVPIAKSYINSESPLFIGNFNNQAGFFFGDINEVKISNTLLSEENIKQNFEKLKH